MSWDFLSTSEREALADRLTEAEAMIRIGICTREQAETALCHIIELVAMQEAGDITDEQGQQLTEKMALAQIGARATDG